jgi:drug/metabolite transporter (DMT)-like permease
MMGNLIYYVCLASAIQRTGAPVSTMIIGTLPVVIPVFANLLYSQRDGKLAWSKMVPALVCTAVGLVCVNIAELRHGQADLTCGVTVLAFCWRSFPWRAGHGMPCAMRAGCGRTRTSTR